MFANVCKCLQTFGLRFCMGHSHIKVPSPGHGPRRPARRPFSARGAPPGEPCGGPRPPRRVGGGRRRVSGAQSPREGPTAPCERNGRPRVGPPPRSAGRRKALPGRGRRGARRAEAACGGARRKSHGGLWPRRSDMRRDRRWPARSTVGIGRAPPLRETTGLAVRPSRQHRLPVTGRRGARPSRGRRGPRRAEAAGAGTRRRSGPQVFQTF